MMPNPTVNELPFDEFHRRVMAVCDDMPPPADVVPENDLKPDPAKLAFEIVQLKFLVQGLLLRVAQLEGQRGPPPLFNL